MAAPVFKQEHPIPTFLVRVGHGYTRKIAQEPPPPDKRAMAKLKGKKRRSLIPISEQKLPILRKHRWSEDQSDYIVKAGLQNIQTRAFWEACAMEMSARYGVTRTGDSCRKHFQKLQKGEGVSDAGNESTPKQFPKSPVRKRPGNSGGGFLRKPYWKLPPKKRHGVNSGSWKKQFPKLRAMKGEQTSQEPYLEREGMNEESTSQELNLERDEEQPFVLPDVMEIEFITSNTEERLSDNDVNEETEEAEDLELSPAAWLLHGLLKDSQHDNTEMSSTLKIDILSAVSVSQTVKDFAKNIFKNQHLKQMLWTLFLQEIRESASTVCVEGKTVLFNKNSMENFCWDSLCAELFNSHPLLSQVLTAVAFPDTRVTDQLESLTSTLPLIYSLLMHERSPDLSAVQRIVSQTCPNNVQTCPNGAQTCLDETQTCPDETQTCSDETQTCSDETQTCPDETPTCPDEKQTFTNEIL